MEIENSNSNGNNTSENEKVDGNKDKKTVYVNDDIYLVMRYVFNIYERLQHLDEIGMLEKTLKVNNKRIRY